MSTSELVRMSLCCQTVDGEEGERQKLGISINGEVLSSLINNIDDVSRIRLKEWFPVLARAHETNDWSSQLYCFDPNLYGSNWYMERVYSSSEFVGLCVWLLFTEHSEINKNDVLEALQIAKSSFREDQYMSNDVQLDEVIEEDNRIVVDVLCLESWEVKKQVCCALALALLVSCDRDGEFAFCDGIQYKLIQLVNEGLATSPSDKLEDSNIICPLRTIAYIAEQDTGMHKKIIETEINKNWLGKIMMKTECVSTMIEACRILHFVVSEKHDKNFWWHTVKALIPGLIRWSGTRNFNLKRVALCAIESITSVASLEYMEEMVVDGGLIEALFEFALDLVYSPDFEYFLDAIRNILNADEIDGPDDDDDDDDDDVSDEGVGELRNGYAEIIDDIEEGWVILAQEDIFFTEDIAVKARRLLSDYAPQYLEKYW